MPDTISLYGPNPFVFQLRQEVEHQGEKYVVVGCRRNPHNDDQDYKKYEFFLQKAKNSIMSDNIGLLNSMHQQSKSRHFENRD